MQPPHLSPLTSLMLIEHVIEFRSGICSFAFIPVWNSFAPAAALRLLLCCLQATFFTFCRPSCTGLAPWSWTALIESAGINKLHMHDRPNSIMQSFAVHLYKHRQTLVGGCTTVSLPNGYKSHCQANRSEPPTEEERALCIFSPACHFTRFCQHGFDAFCWRTCFPPLSKTQ